MKHSNAFCSVTPLQLGGNCCNFIVIFALLSSATLKCKRAFKVANRFVVLLHANVFVCRPVSALLRVCRVLFDCPLWYNNLANTLH